mmetsp:Transcript_60586/g.136888  ORF Transcript_60586/g.136888 Transcript_60586/m.136888 type:complete len:202 (-) Transcript_60586:17-622(-)
MALRLVADPNSIVWPFCLTCLVAEGTRLENHAMRAVMNKLEEVPSLKKITRQAGTPIQCTAKLRTDFEDAVPEKRPCAGRPISVSPLVPPFMSPLLLDIPLACIDRFPSDKTVGKVDPRILVVGLARIAAATEQQIPELEQEATDAAASFRVGLGDDTALRGCLPSRFLHLLGVRASGSPRSGSQGCGHMTVKLPSQGRRH